MHENIFFDLFATIQVFNPGFINSPDCFIFICGKKLRNCTFYIVENEKKLEVPKKTLLVFSTVSKLKVQGPVVQRWISANPWLKFNLLF
jgi:hypothetical protein